MFKKSIICAVAALSIAAAAASPANAHSRNGALALGLGIGTAAAIGIASSSPSYQPVDYREHRHRDGGGVYLGFGGPGFGIYSGGYYPDYYNRGDYYRPEGGGYRFWSRRCADRWGYNTSRWNRCMDRHGF